MAQIKWIMKIMNNITVAIAISNWIYLAAILCGIQQQHNAHCNFSSGVWRGLYIHGPFSYFCKVESLFSNDPDTNKAI